MTFTMAFLVASLVALLKRFHTYFPSDLRQAKPTTASGAGWAVYDYLCVLESKASDLFARMTPEQQVVYAINSVRAEVASGGFNGYFGWTKGETAEKAIEALSLFSPQMSEIVREATAEWGKNLREDRGVTSDFEDLDTRFYGIESSLPLDELVDGYVAENESGLFK